MSDISLEDHLKKSFTGAMITRLFAEENIRVEYSGNTKTPTYDPLTKTVIYPFLMCMSDNDIHETLIFTESAKVLFPFKDHDFLGELASIQQFLKKYPLAEKTMLRGYSKLFDKNFFGKREIIALARFSVRFNFYIRCGNVVASFIEFTKEEMSVIEKFLSGMFSLDEIAKMVKKIDDSFHFTIRARIEEMRRNEEYSEFIDRYHDEYTDDDGTNWGDTTQSLIDECYAISTDFLESNLARDAVTSYTMIAHSPTDYAGDNYIVRLYDQNLYIHDERMEETRNFRHSAKRIVDGMVKIFESKKAANRLRNAKISRTGMLNINRVVNYRFSDDIFLNQMTLADAKNHGFVILLDCSGSIQSMYKDMAEQVIVLVEFFRSIGVKYRVFGFGCEGFEKKYPPNIHTFKQGPYSSEIPKGIIEFLNDDMKKDVHAKACTIMHHRIGFTLGHTPTNTTVSQMEHIANNFFSKNQIQVKKMIIVTDGQPTDSLISGYKKTIVFDPQSRKMYKKEGFDYSTIDIQGAIFRDRYGIELISIALFPRFSDPYEFVGCHSTEDDKATMRKYGYVKFESPLGNHVFVAKSVSVDDDLSGMKVDNDMSISKTTTAFVSKLNKMNKSKNFLNILANTLSV